MAAKKTAKRPELAEDPRSPLGRVYFGRDGRPRVWVAYVGLAAALALGGFVAWHKAGPLILVSSDYQLTPDKVELEPPPPPWIRSDVRGQALRTGRLDTPQSLLAPDLTERAYQAFSVHPWIEKVLRVSKGHPAWLRVEVQYRRPVAMVQVDGNLLPVAADAVLLPHEDFSPVDSRGYPRIEGIENLPASSPGAAWGDARVLGAAQIAAAVGDRWKALNLERIRPSRSKCSLRPKRKSSGAGPPRWPRPASRALPASSSCWRNTWPIMARSTTQVPACSSISRSTSRSRPPLRSSAMIRR
jgi:hypothetical protein